MRIVSPPRKNLMTRKKRCWNCEAVLEYKKTDIKSYTDVDLSGTRETEYKIRCPACLSDIKVEQW